MAQRTFAKRLQNADGSVIKKIFGLMADPGIISFSGGSPARESFPTETIEEIIEQSLRENGASILQYGLPAGWPPLVDAYIRHILQPRGISASKENILITTGGTQGFDALVKAFIDPGDTVLVESPTFMAALTTLQLAEANIVPVKMDEHGMCMKDFAEKVWRCKPKMLYTIPTFQNPSGRTLSVERRKRVAELCAQHNFIVAEDDPYCDLRYEGKALPQIRSFDTEGNVVLIHSFSKIISPGLRVGAVNAAPEIIDNMLLIKQCEDTHTSNLSQQICAEYLNRGLLPGHLKATLPLYEKRMQAMLEGIEKYFPPGCEYTRPEGGLFIWVRLPGNVDTMPLLEEAVREIKVAFVPGAPYCADPAEGRSCLRLNFSACTPERIQEGMQLLGAFFRKACGGGEG